MEKVQKSGCFPVTITIFLALIFVIVALYFYFVFGFFGYQGREPYAGSVVYEVYCHFLFGLDYIDHFPKDENEFLKMLQIVQQKAPEYGRTSYKKDIKYRLIEDKGDEVLFLIIVDSTKNISFITYRGSINTGLGKAKKDEKGEWHGSIEWFYRTGTAVDKF